MGELGFPSRFLSLKFGAPWIYAAFNKERGVAPGIPGAEDFRTTYPVRCIDKDTEFYGVCGDPVSHSLSPVIHNHMYQRLKVNAVYVPFLVPKGTLAAHVEAYDDVPIAEHLARHGCADLFLDTLPYNAHTSACDALWAGLPVLTRMGETFAGRVGASVLHAVGLPELREAIAAWAQRRFGVTLDPETEVIPTLGSKEAIFSFALAVVDADGTRDTVAYTDPGYPVYERGALFAHARPLALPLHEEHGFLHGSKR